jgi:hypothetical protein
MGCIELVAMIALLFLRSIETCLYAYACEFNAYLIFAGEPVVLHVIKIADRESPS